MAPDTFRYDGGQSAVWRQPVAGSEEEALALRCVNACPTGSIHFRDEERGKGKFHHEKYWSLIMCCSHALARAAVCGEAVSAVVACRC
jgi:hypothetical protein